MKSIVKVRNIKIGEGIPKICVPIVARTNEALIAEANHIKNIKVDVVEWRIDYHQDVEDLDKIIASLTLLRGEIGNLPLLVTFRSKKEGGEKEITTTYYKELNHAIIKSGKADLIDIELFTGDEIVRALVDEAHQNNVKVVMSNHDFHKTPTKEEIINRLCKMQHLGADLPKIAVMPQNTADVLTLLTATNEMVKEHADRPIITMSMSGLGVISRISGEIFGSALTFGAAKEVSAPGQLAVDQLEKVLNIMHKAVE